MQRVLTSLVLSAAVLAAVFHLPSGWFLGFVVVFLELAALELVRIGRVWAPDAPLNALLLLLPVLIVLLALGFPAGPGSSPESFQPSSQPFSTLVLLSTVVVLGIVVPTVVLLGRTPAAQSLPAVGCLGFGALYLALPALSCWRLQQMDPWLVVLLLAVVAAGDTAAFYFGSRFGKRRMSPLISPNKTWLGAAAGFIAAVLIVAVWCWWRLGRIDPSWLVLGVAVAVAAQGGDLVESMLKRGAGIKDSGRMLPGHGGILDRADSVLFAAPVLLYGLVLIARLDPTSP